MNSFRFIMKWCIEWMTFKQIWVGYFGAIWEGSLGQTTLEIIDWFWWIGLDYCLYLDWGTSEINTFIFYNDFSMTLWLMSKGQKRVCEGVFRFYSSTWFPSMDSDIYWLEGWATKESRFLEFQGENKLNLKEKTKFSKFLNKIY